jgi:D-galactarolactone cycloisomerase
MKITEIRGFNLSFPLAEPMGNALNLFRKRDALLVQICTDSGLSGWGEAGNSPHAAGALSAPGWPDSSWGNRPPSMAATFN